MYTPMRVTVDVVNFGDSPRMLRKVKKKSCVSTARKTLDKCMGLYRLKHDC